LAQKNAEKRVSPMARFDKYQNAHAYWGQSGASRKGRKLAIEEAR
jgi:hypothetical protein